MSFISNMTTVDRTSEFKKYTGSKKVFNETINQNMRIAMENYDILTIIKYDIIMLIPKIESKAADFPLIETLKKVNKQLKQFDHHLSIIRVIDDDNDLIKNIIYYLNRFYIEQKAILIVLQNMVYEHDLKILMGLFYTFTNLCTILPEHRDYWNMIKHQYNNIVKLVENDAELNIIASGKNVNDFKNTVKNDLVSWNVKELSKKYIIYTIRSTNIEKCIITQIIRDNMTILKNYIEHMGTLYNKQIKSYDVIKKLYESLMSKYKELTSASF